MSLTLEQKKGLLDFLMQYVSDARKNTFDRVIANRTRYVTVVLENIFQPHNASAVLRTCDLMGVQDVHIIDDKIPYRVNPDVALGSSKWLNLYHYSEAEDNTLHTFDKLRRQGYKIVATTPHKDDYDLDQLPLDNKVALVFGTELKGLSPEALQHADMYVKIPMYGFTESFNISVSAAIILHHLVEKIRRKDVRWELLPEEKTDILLQWAKNSIKMSKELEAHYFQHKTKSS